MKIRIDSLHSALLVASIFGYPLVASITSVLSVDNTPFSLVLRVLIVLAAFSMLATFRPNQMPMKVYRVVQLASVFWFLYILRICFDTFLHPEILGRSWTFYWIWGIGASLLPFVAITSYMADPHDQKTFKRIAVIMLVTIIAAIISGSTSGIRNGSAVDQGRFQLAALNAISLGNVGAVALLLAVWKLTISPFRPKSLTYKLFFVFTALLGLYLLLLTGSRGPLAGMIVALSFIILNSGLSTKLTTIVLVFAFLFFGYIILTSYSEGLGIDSLDRYLRVGSQEDLSSVGRIYLITSGWLEFRESPFFGSGLEVRSISFYPHNLFLESFMATGILGGGLFVLSTLIGLVYANRLLKFRLSSSWVSLVFIHYLVLGQFSGALYGSTSFWTALGGVLAVYGGYLRSVDANTSDHGHGVMVGEAPDRVGKDDLGKTQAQ